MSLSFLTLTYFLRKEASNEAQLLNKVTQIWHFTITLINTILKIDLPFEFGKHSQIIVINSVQILKCIKILRDSFTSSNKVIKRSKYERSQTLLRGNFN
jgi:hypothetical protein